MCISHQQRQSEVSNPNIFSTLLQVNQPTNKTKLKMPCPCGSGCKCATQTPKGVCNCGTDCKCGGDNKAKCGCSSK
ncbi:metallothionein-1 [Drosophila obscura]|uniref:metallothionein-1 n=1 Tax=Drosophila obscura TaxID=7282 RepID=UPI000BA0FF81|nr:metallothionein-1 [Drosophila obscura]